MFDYHRGKESEKDKTKIKKINDNKHCNKFVLWSPKFTHKIKIYKLQDQLGKLIHKVIREKIFHCFDKESLAHSATTVKQHLNNIKLARADPLYTTRLA